MVGVLGFEPRTSSLSGTRSNQLSYTPLNPLKVATLRPRPNVGLGMSRRARWRGSIRARAPFPAFRAASPYSCLRDWMMSARTGSYQISRPVIFLDLSIKVRQRSTATSRSGTLPPFDQGVTTEHRDTSERHVCRRPNVGLGMSRRARWRGSIRAWCHSLRYPLKVEPKGLEPSTSCLQSRCSSQLSYGPLKLIKFFINRGELLRNPFLRGLNFE